MMDRPFRVLVVDDEVSLGEVVRDYLVQAGMEVDLLDNGSGVTSILLAGHYDLAVLDLMMPGVDGLTICREVRRSSDVPMVITTARVEEIDRLLGLELGADDYLCKPFSPRELVARVRAVLRRTGRPVAAEPVAGGRVVVDKERWQALVDGRPLGLTRREFQILEVMAARPGRVFQRAQLLDLAFPDDADVVDRTIDTHIKNIRRKIAAVADWDPVRSVYGVGYSFDG